MHCRRTLSLVLLTFCLSCGGSDSQKGDQFFGQGKYEQAINEYDQYLEYNPDDFKSMYNRGRAYEELKDYDKALNSYEAALKMDEKNINVLISLGRYYFRENKFKDAAFYFDKATQVNQNSPLAQYLKGRAYHKAGETGQAMEAYNTAISMRKEYGEAYLYRGALKIYLGRKRSGCSDLKTAQSLQVANAEAALAKYCN